MNFTRKMATTLTCVAVAMAFTLDADAQRKRKAPDASQSASVSQTIGTDNQVTISYHRPGVKGRDVWNEKSDNPQIGPLVPKNGKPRPWRAGANESTSIEVKQDVKIEGKDLAAGTYSLFMIPRDDKWTVIINKEVKWGSFMYKAENDVLQVEVTPEAAPHQEWLSYGFDNPLAYSTTAYLRWDKIKVPFKITMDEK